MEKNYKMNNETFVTIFKVGDRVKIHTDRYLGKEQTTGKLSKHKYKRLYGRYRR